MFATQIPFVTMQKSYDCFELCKAMAEQGNPNSVSDAGVGALCARAAVYGAYLNVKINAGGLKNKALGAQLIKDAEAILQKAIAEEQAILKIVEDKL